VQIFAGELQSVARYLNQVRHPGDTLFTWNYMPLVYFETGMPSPTRLLSAHYLYDSKKSRDKYGEEMLRQLKQPLPGFIVDATADPERLASQDRIYGDFYELVKKDYELLYVVEDRGTYLVPGNIRIYGKKIGNVW
jgi:hypothetical protein